MDICHSPESGTPGAPLRPKSSTPRSGFVQPPRYTVCSAKLNPQLQDHLDAIASLLPRQQLRYEKVVRVGILLGFVETWNKQMAFVANLVGFLLEFYAV